MDVAAWTLLCRYPSVDERSTNFNAACSSTLAEAAPTRESSFLPESLSYFSVAHPVVHSQPVQIQHSTTDVPATAPTQFDINHASSLRAASDNRPF